MTAGAGFPPGTTERCESPRRLRGCVRQNVSGLRAATVHVERAVTSGTPVAQTVGRIVETGVLRRHLDMSVALAQVERLRFEPPYGGVVPVRDIGPFDHDRPIEFHRVGRPDHSHPRLVWNVRGDDICDGSASGRIADGTAWSGGVIAVGRALEKELLLGVAEILEDDIGCPVCVVVARRSWRIGRNRAGDRRGWDDGLGD